MIRPYIIALALAAFGSATITAAPDYSYGKKKKEEGPKLIAALFYADWCTSCEALDPKVEEAKEDLKDKPVIFAKLDFTDESTTEAAKAKADQLSMGKIYEKYSPKTGFMILVDKKSGEKVGDAITLGYDVYEIKKAIEDAL